MGRMCFESNDQLPIMRLEKHRIRQSDGKRGACDREQGLCDARLDVQQQWRSRWSRKRQSAGLLLWAFSVRAWLISVGQSARTWSPARWRVLALNLVFSIQHWSHEGYAAAIARRRWRFYEWCSNLPGRKTVDGVSRRLFDQTITYHPRLFLDPSSAPWPSDSSTLNSSCCTSSLSPKYLMRLRRQQTWKATQLDRTSSAKEEAWRSAKHILHYGKTTSP